MRAMWVLLVGCSSSATSWSAEVGPEGGQIVGRGVELWVPAGALDSTTEITITRIDADPPSRWRALSDAYRFEPEGLTFASPVEVRFETRGSDAGERVLWQSDTLEVLEATRGGNLLSAEVSHFSRGMAGTPSGDDGGTDAGVDASSDAATDAATDAGSDAGETTNLDCWNDELLPSEHISSRLVTRGTEVLYTDHEILWRRDEAGTWTSTNLPEEIGFGPAEPEWRDSVMTVDDDGHIHVVLDENSDLGVTVPNFPYHVRETDAGWVVERVPYEQHYIYDYPERGPCNTGTLGGGPADLFLTDLLVHEDEVHLTFECRWYGGWAQHSVLHCLRDGSWQTCTMLEPLGVEHQQRGGPRATQLGVSERSVHLYMNGRESSFDEPSDDGEWWIVGEWNSPGWSWETRVEGVEPNEYYPGRLLPSSRVLYYQRTVWMTAGSDNVVHSNVRRAEFDLEAGIIERSTVWSDEPWIFDLARIDEGWNPGMTLSAATDRFGVEYVLVRPNNDDSQHIMIAYRDGDTVVQDVPVACELSGLRTCSLVVDESGSLHAAYTAVAELPPYELHHSWTCE